MQMHEHAILAIGVRVSQRFGLDGNQPLAFLAGGFGDELFEPRAQRGNIVRRYERDLVAAALLCQNAKRYSQLQSRACLGRHDRLRTCDGTACFLQQATDIKTHGRSRHETEGGEHGKPSADRRLAVENVPEFVALGDLFPDP